MTQLTKLTIKTGTEDAFFKRGRQLAKAADSGKTIAPERIISFEDPFDLVKLITAPRFKLFLLVLFPPGSSSSAYSSSARPSARCLYR